MLRCWRSTFRLGVLSFFGSYDHLTAPGGWGDNRDRFYCPLCHIGGKYCFDLGFPVERDWYRCVLCKRHCSFFDVDHIWLAVFVEITENVVERLTVMSWNWSRRYFPSLGIFSAVARCGSLNGCCGNCGWVVDVDGVVVSAGGLIWVVVVAATNAGEVWGELLMLMGYGNWYGNLCLSRHPFLLK